jgi:hypothetical protein
MQLVYSGIGLELLALAGIVLHDLFQIPVIFGILLHIGAVYLFTRGIETWLHKIRLIREVCFLLCLLLSIYGMLGILFQIFVLKKIRILTFVLKDQQPQADPEQPQPGTAFLFESEPAPGLVNFNLKKVRYDSFPGNGRVLACNYFHSARYKQLVQETLARIEALKKETEKDPDNHEPLQELAASYLDYAAAFETEKAVKQKYLLEAKMIYEKLLQQHDEDQKLLAQLMEIQFLLGKYDKCKELCKKLLARDRVHEQAVVRLAECYYKKREYKKITELAGTIKTLVKKPEDLNYFTGIWASDG